MDDHGIFPPVLVGTPLVHLPSQGRPTHARAALAFGLIALTGPDRATTGEGADA